MKRHPRRCHATNKYATKKSEAHDPNESQIIVESEDLNGNVSLTSVLSLEIPNEVLDKIFEHSKQNFVHCIYLKHVNKKFYGLVSAYHKTMLEKDNENLRRIFLNRCRHKMYIATRCYVAENDLESLKWFSFCFHLMETKKILEETIEYAIEKNRINFLEWFHKSGYVYNKYIWIHAACVANIDLFRWIRERSADFNEDVCDYLRAKNDRYEKAIQWLIDMKELSKKEMDKLAYQSDSSISSSEDSPEGQFQVGYKNFDSSSDE
jgi:hypothetical protein